MKLNITLPDDLKAKLSKVTNEAPIYCIKADLDSFGSYCENCYVGATKSYVFCFERGDSRFFKVSDCETASHRNLVGSAVLTVKKDGEEYPVARCSMNYISRFACLARGIRLLIAGDFDRQIESNEKEKICPKCGRLLPGTAQCPKCEGRHKNIKRLLSLCRPFVGVLILVTVLMFLDSAVRLGSQYMFRRFIDGYLSVGKGSVSVVLGFFAVYFGLTLLEIGGFLYRTYLCGKMGIEVSDGLRKRITAHINSLSLAYINKRSAGELIERAANDTYSVRQFLNDCFCNMFNQMVMLVALVVIMLIMNWRLALAAFVFAPLILIFARTFWPFIRRIFHHQWRKMDKIQNKLQDVLSGIRIVKSYGKEREEIEVFNELNDDFAATQRRNEKFFATFFPILSLLLSFGTYLIVYLGGIEVLGGSMTPGELMQFVSYAGMLLGPLSWMSFLPRRLISMTTSLERIYDILDEKPEITADENAVSIKVKGDISLQNVNFGYRSYEPVLEGVDLEVKQGEMIGLVGASGSGKSTLINLIMRLYDVDEGRILIDGHDLKSIDPACYHDQLGVVLQETFLFAGTVLDNIRFARPDASLEEVIKAAKCANAHDFICKLPDGYNTYIGERGHNLSGGEKQRVAIARAVLGDPKILILDEATSALDTESEYQVQQAIERLRKGRTTFAIAHRLSTLRCADRIAVINDHKIAELGTHNELLKLKGIYYGLVMAQLTMNSR